MTHEKVTALLAILALIGTLLAADIVGRWFARRDLRAWREFNTYRHRRNLGGVFDHEHEEDWR